MSMIKQQLLKKLGFTEVMAKTYLALLELKKTTVLGVARHTGVARTNIYHGMVALKEMHLVSEVIEGKKWFLIPESPENLMVGVKLQEQLARQAARIFLPDFQKEHYEARIKFYEGAEGVKRLHEETLKSKEKFLRSIGPLSMVVGSLSSRYSKAYWQKRVKTKLHVRYLNSVESKDIYLRDKRFSSVSNIRWLREVRFLPSGIQLNFFIMTIDDKVLFFAPAKEGYSFSFQSPSFAGTVKSIFDFLWNISEPLK